MRSTQVKSLDAGRRVQGFLDTHADAVGRVVPPTLRAELDRAVANISAFRAEQGAMSKAAHGETEHQRVLKEDVYKRVLLPIARIARVARRVTPDFPTLSVMANTKRTSDFVAQAATVVDAAAKQNQVFVNNGLPGDFADQVKAIVAQINASVDVRARYLSRRFAATKALEAAEVAVRDTIGVLDGVITPLLEGDAALLGDWNASKRIHQTGSTPLPGGDTTQPTDGTEPDSPAPLTLSSAEPLKDAA